MNHICLDPENIVLGSVLRRALFCLLTKRVLRYDRNRSAALNDLIFGEIIQTPSASFAQLKYNSLERLYAHAKGARLKNERIEPGPCIGVVGNRYAPPYLIGGLHNPITGQPNGTVSGGTVVDGLLGVNVVGYVNRAADPEERVRIEVRGVLVDRHDCPINLSRFRERLPDVGESVTPEPPLIVVAGHSTNAGKTTCAWALVNALRSRGFTVTMEKKTGTACCRDWLRCYAGGVDGALENEGDEFLFTPESFPARDFVDALGVASDVSIETKSFVTEGVRYTRAFLSQTRPDFHVIELADSISHASNAGLLRTKYFRQNMKVFVYSCVPTHEAAAHFLAYLRSLGYDGTRVLLSGPLANEQQYAMARDEVRERLPVTICRSAIRENGRWIPEGRELASAVLEATSHSSFDVSASVL
jgi:hypothetical protein